MYCLEHKYNEIGKYHTTTALSSFILAPGNCVSTVLKHYNNLYQMTIQVGDKVEVIGFEPGFEHSYFAGKVIRAYNDTFEVQYEDLVLTKGGEQIIEMIDAGHVRPYPPHIDYNIDNFERGFVQRRMVGWNHTRCILQHEQSEALRSIFFNYMPEKKQYDSYKPEKVRPQQFWVGVNNE
ncbi:hypothetical protein LXL04_028572 [Taraxacum kok-saghyz]